KRELGDEPAPLFREVRALILRKCEPNTERHVRAVFEKQPFGELERLVSEKLLDVVEGVARQEAEHESWLRPLENLGRRTSEAVLKEFLQDSSLSGTATAKEVAFLKRLKFQGQRPTPLYYYRELQNLRDPLHFRTSRTEQGKGT